jgi:hypothetical protein
MNYLDLIDQRAAEAHAEIKTVIFNVRMAVAARFDAIASGTRAEPYYRAAVARMNRSAGQKRRRNGERQRKEQS